MYDHIDFKVPVSFNGDSYDRYLLRIEELRQSNNILLTILNKLPAGSVKVEDHKIVPPSRVAIKNEMESLIHHFK